MRIRWFVQNDLTRVTELTIETFGPFYENFFRTIVGDVVFANQHGNWRDNYRTQVAELHEPRKHKYVAVAETDDAIAGYIAWSIDPTRRDGHVTILAIAAEHRRRRFGSALCEHAFDHMRTLGTEVAVIGTGGDPFHAPARALYEQLGCTFLPVAVYYRQL
jgi:ribosomal protein S18 acetylase RimI-like enzyme